MCRFYGVDEKYLLDDIDYILFQVKARDMAILELYEQLSLAYSSNADEEYVKKLKFNLEYLEGSNKKPDLDSLKIWRGKH